jgi:hypothetical protein
MNNGYRFDAGQAGASVGERGNSAARKLYNGCSGPTGGLPSHCESDSKGECHGAYQNRALDRISSARPCGAEETLPDRQRFELNAARWDAFQKAASGGGRIRVAVDRPFCVNASLLVP